MATGRLSKVDETDGSSDLDDLAVLSKTRKYVRQRITKLTNKVLMESATFDQEQRDIHVAKLNSLRDEISNLDKQIISYSIKHKKDENLENVMSENESYEDKLLTSLSRLKPAVAAADMGNLPIGSAVPPKKLKLPTIPLPKFDNTKGQSLEKFIYNFESIVDKHVLTSYEKFTFFKNQLGGSPLTIIESLDITEQHYETAKELIIKAFGSNLTQKFESIKLLTELKLSNTDNPYSFIGQMRTVCNSFKNLDVDVKTVLQYFIWNGLNENFQNHLIAMTNCNKPSLDQINEHIFDATERYLKSKKVGNKSKISDDECSGASTSHNLAVKSEVKSMKNKTPNCSLCGADGKQSNHWIRNCPIYETPAAKVNKLKSLNQCIKCSFKNHVTNKCKFVFTSKCSKCGGEHMSYLCLSSSRNNPKPPAQATESTGTTNGASWVHALGESSLNDGIILPTLSVTIKNQNLRCFKDGGCQRNFIVEAVADDLDLPTVEKIKINIHGFNSSSTLDTRVVEVPITVAGRTIKLNAVCIPAIRMKLKINELSQICRAFLDKGYELADENLLTGNKIDNIKIVLGADADHLFPMKYVMFGEEQPTSCFIDSPVGILLTGNSNRILNNVKFLPIRSGSRVGSSALVSFEGNPTKDEKDIFDDTDYPSVIDTEARFLYSNTDDDLTNAKILDRATNDILNRSYNRICNYPEEDKMNETIINTKILNYLSKNTVQDKDGRLIMPILWNHKIAHRLSNNFHISRNILFSNLKKLTKEKDKLLMYDESFREQEKSGIIERVENMGGLSQREDVSFLAHMGVFKLDRETTKCRIVFLSNLAEKFPNEATSICHNQAILPGPSLNHKISTSVLHLRFDSYMLTFDLRKAFLSIGLRERDKNRLHFLWFRNVLKEDFSIVAYRAARLPFGLRCSPCLLMYALHRILIVDIDKDDERTKDLKRSIYNLIFMDNGAITSNDKETMEWSYSKLTDIFEPYQFFLQQYNTNETALQAQIDGQEETPAKVKLFGMSWHRPSDTLEPLSIGLNAEANTKRSILSTFNSIYDIFNLYTPLLNRAKLFLQSLQSMKSLDWDTVLPEDLQKEWGRIVKQLNIPIISIPRSMGSRCDSYQLVCFTDASATIYGTVIYMRNLTTGNVFFLQGKNRLVNKQSERRTIPSLELQAINFGTQLLVEVVGELSGPNVQIPISISSCLLYTDSLVCLQWIRSYFYNFDKMQKRSVFVLNRLRDIGELACKVPVTFKFTSGKQNPADAITRQMSYKQLMKTEYYSGPEYIKFENLEYDEFTVALPNPIVSPGDEIPCALDTEESIPSVNVQSCHVEHLIPVDQYSSFARLVNVHKMVIRFISNLKSKIGLGDQGKNFAIDAVNKIVSIEQRLHLPEVFRYFERGCNLSEMPSLAKRLNLFIDKNSLIRVKCKFINHTSYPILLPKTSKITDMIIMDCHERNSHAGIYSILKELRPKFYIECCFSRTRGVLRNCVVCRRSNARTIKINQNRYREFRMHPPRVPFSTVFIDYIGPYAVRKEGKKTKVWLLIITCMWSRAVNLKICIRANVEEFLRALQLHIYEHGLFRLCMSDLGSQICAGATKVANYIDDFETQNFLDSHGIEMVKFEQYCKGSSSLGSLVEICVKHTKRLIFKTIGHNVLNFHDFNFLICKIVHLINRRPVAFLEVIRDTTTEENLPEPITPEMLLRGRELPSMNVIPELHPVEDDPCEFDSKNIRSQYSKLQRVNSHLIELYHTEFLAQLTRQATDKPNRYKPVTHVKLKAGDIVLLADPLLKQSNYPLGKIISVETNNLGETVAAYVLKGSTRERVYRHATSLILILPSDVEGEDRCTEPPASADSAGDADNTLGGRPQRGAAIESRISTRSLINQHAV